MQGQSCGKCAYCHAENSTDFTQGECRWGPPHLTSFPVRGPLQGSMGLQKITSYPVVQIRDRGCAQFKPKLEVIQDAQAGQEDAET